MHTLLLTIFLVTIFPAAVLRAQEDMFQDTADEIVKKADPSSGQNKRICPEFKNKNL